MAKKKAKRPRNKTREQIAAEIRENFARNVRILRHRKGWRQADLADKLGWHRATINRIETGATQPLFSEACILADALGVSIVEMRAYIGE